MELTKADKQKFLLARGVMSDAENARDISVVIENTIGIEYILTLIASGVQVKEIYSSLGIDSRSFDLVMKSSPDLRKRYIQAKCFRLADLSAQTLMDTGFATATSFTKNEKNAVDYHGANLDRMTKMETEKNTTSGVVVNNTIVVRGKDEVPSLPEELEDVFDADFTIRT